MEVAGGDGLAGGLPQFLQREEPALQVLEELARGEELELAAGAAEEALRAADIAPKQRGEKLAVEDFVRLAGI